MHTHVDWQGADRFVKATASDALAIADLNRQFHLDIPDFPWDTIAWVEEEIKHGNYYVIRDEKGVAGAVCLHVSQQCGIIETMAVRANLHGTGLGRALIEHSKSLFRSALLHTVQVESFCEYGVSGFYESCGFTRASQLEQYKGHYYYCFSMSLGGE